MNAPKCDFYAWCKGMRRYIFPFSFTSAERQITPRILGYHFTYRLTATLNLWRIYFKITWALAILLEHMHKKFEINRIKIKDGCQSGRKVVTHNSKSDLPLAYTVSCLSDVNKGVRVAHKKINKKKLCAYHKKPNLFLTFTTAAVRMAASLSTVHCLHCTTS